MGGQGRVRWKEGFKKRLRVKGCEIETVHQPSLLDQEKWNGSEVPCREALERAGSKMFNLERRYLEDR